MAQIPEAAAAAPAGIVADRDAATATCAVDAAVAAEEGACITPVERRRAGCCGGGGCCRPRQRGEPRAPRPFAWHFRLAFRLSWALNWSLLVLKLVAFIISRSKVVLASLTDSGVDLASQIVLAIAEHQKKRYHPHYPVGRARLEAIAVIVCACIMAISSLEVIQFAGMDLYNGFAKGELPEVDMSPLMFGILGGGTALKLALGLYCYRLRVKSDSMKALAEDHLNDVAGNGGAIVAAIVVRFWRAGWWVDAVSAIVISLVIAGRWVHLTYEQVTKIVGRAAPDDFKAQVEGLADGHHPELSVDCTRVYHFGARYLVEMEVILPAEMRVMDAHDISLSLQHKIEEMEEVERAFVHVDYLSRSLPEHKVERDLLAKHEAREALRRTSSGGSARSARSGRESA